MRVLFLCVFGYVIDENARARRLAQDLTHPLITMLQQECTRQTCPEMKAGEWLYLCVAHGNSGAMEVRINTALTLNSMKLIRGAC